MSDLQSEMALGEISQRTLDELKSRFTLIEENLVSKWKETSSRQMEDREILYHQMHALRELKRSFVNDINTGKMAEKQLETENASNKQHN